jgi:hypothetical protein
MKLLNRIIENNEMKIRVLPLLLLFSPRSVLNSLCSFFNNKFHIRYCREGINHILVGSNISPITVLIQLRGALWILVDGSNTENKFLIIFSLFLW